MERWQARKVVIVGAGAVGSTFAYALAQSGVADEIVLTDMDQSLAQGQVMDLAHGLPFYPNVQIRLSTPQDYQDAHVIVITAGSKQRPGESRLDLISRNAKIIENIMDEITAQGSQAVVVVVGNPVDILTYVAQKRVNWPHGRVIGSGTVLDSARLRYLLSQHCGVDVHNVHAYILGTRGTANLLPGPFRTLPGCALMTTASCAENVTIGMKSAGKLKKPCALQPIISSITRVPAYFAAGQALVRMSAPLCAMKKAC